MDAPKQDDRTKSIGFWGTWSLTVGCMIGSGIFLLPTVLAPYGLFGLAGWIITGAGAICIALVLGKLTKRTPRTGGPAAFVEHAFGVAPGFVAGWSLWVSAIISIPTVAIAFVAYFGSLFPVVANSGGAQIGVALCLIWGLTLISIMGAREASLAAIVMTALKLVPLIIVIALAGWAGDFNTLQPLIIPEVGLLPALAATALLTMWAFLGIEAGVIAADEVVDPERTIPRAVIFGVLAVTAVYILVTVATMVLVPANQLAISEAPLVDATRSLGKAGFLIVAIGALISTAGSSHATVFASSQLVLGMSNDGLVPRIFAKRNAAGAPVTALIIGSSLSSILLLANYSKGLVGAFTFLLMMSTATALLPYLLCALAELKHSWRSSRGWIALSFIAGMYALFAIVGSGLNILIWGAILIVCGLPIFYYGQRQHK